jgi:hypothetical protein
MAQFMEICKIKANAINTYEQIDGVPVNFIFSRHSVITFDDLYTHGYQIDVAASVDAVTFELWNRRKSLRMFNISFRDLVMNGNITERDIVENPHLNWKYVDLLENPNISATFLWKRRRIDEPINGREVRRYCADVKTRDSFECMFIHKQLEGYWQFNAEIMRLCSELFNIDVILRYKELSWRWDVIQERRDIPMTYRLFNQLLCPWLSPKLTAEYITAELQYERGEAHLWSIYTKKADYQKKVMESPIYSWQLARELNLTYEYYRSDAPPYVWVYNEPVEKMIGDMTVDDIIT